MDSPIAIVVLIIVLAGIVGGLAGALTEAAAAAPDEPVKSAPIGRYLLLGIIAAACVPLFLSLLKSELIRLIFTTLAADGKSPAPPAYEAYLIFTGLCLVAAFSARRFINSVTSQVLQRIDEVEAKARLAKAAAEEARDVAQDAANEVEAADNIAGASLPPELAARADADAGGERPTLTPAERRVLEAMATRVYRSRSGIAADSGVSRNAISDLLEELADKKLAMPTVSPRTGGNRWTITKKGRAALAPAG